MSTRANIEFKDSWGKSIRIDRSHDGFPDVILPDLQEAFEICERRFKGGEQMGQLVSIFYGIHYEPETRVQPYEPCIGYDLAGDESYEYLVTYNKETHRYTAVVKR